MVVITFIIQKLAKSYFTLQGVKVDQKRSVYIRGSRKALEMSEAVTINKGDVGLTQPLLEQVERESERKQNGELEQEHGVE